MGNRQCSCAADIEPWRHIRRASLGLGGGLRRPPKVLVAATFNFSLASGLMALMPGSGSWIFLAACQFVFGFGFAGLQTQHLIGAAKWSYLAPWSIRCTLPLFAAAIPYRAC
jgi:hypothetical protein